MRRWILGLLAAALLTGSVSAVQPYEAPTDFTGQTLEQIMEDFMEENLLTEENFSISFYNTVTGEAYAFNDTKFSIAASTYKLPLNMYFYEMQQAGEITGDTVITWTGQTLDTIHQRSIVDSNNELSEALMYYWGDHTTYKENMRKYFTMTDEEIDPLYYQGNYYCVRMMMDTLHYLYDHSEDFEELLGYMKIAMPGSYFKTYVDEFEIAHKYGQVQIFGNDVGIIYTPQPILLAVYTQGIYGEGVCARAARLLTNYTLWEIESQKPEVRHEDLTVEEVEPEPDPEPQPAPEPESIPESNSAPESPADAQTDPASEQSRTAPRWLMGVGLGALGAAVLLLLHRRRS